MVNILRCNGIGVYGDYVLAVSNIPIICSYYERSLQNVKAFSANLNRDKIRGSSYYGYITSSYYDKEPYSMSFAPIIVGKERFYHAVAISPQIKTKYFVCRAGDEGKMLYNHLMANFKYPLKKEWVPALFDYMLKMQDIQRELSTVTCFGEEEPTIKFDGEMILVKDLCVYSMGIDEIKLESAIKRLFDVGAINIVPEKVPPLKVTNLDSYFETYSVSIVDNLNKIIKPLKELDGNLPSVAFNNMRLYPQQAAQANGIVELLKNSNYAIVNQGMGTGKTIETISMCESYFNKKYMNSHKGATLKDALSDGAVNYRNIVMCPATIVSKWATTIKEEVPGAKVTELVDFSQVLEIYERGIERNGKEWFVISKDFAKLSYSERPVPTKVRKKNVSVWRCADCGRVKILPGKEPCNCGCNEWVRSKTSVKREGLICPCCGELVLPFSKGVFSGSSLLKDELRPHDFATKSEINKACYYCGTSLWDVNVSNIGRENKSVWYRATHYTNANKKEKKTVWVHRDFKDWYFKLIGRECLALDSQPEGVRRYAPAAFIKKKLKGFFDIAIFDEMHLYKGAGTAQGNSMHAIIKSSKKQLGLTGTIAGGYANHFFYTLYRLDPRRMKQRGYDFDDEFKFSCAYGTIERTYEYNMSKGSATYNVSSRGKQIKSPRVKPGISPLIFTDFLLDRTVFLDLSDFSKYLPVLKESVVEVEGEPEVISTIKEATRVLKERARKDGLGVLSSMLQFNLAYPDKPYCPPICSPKDGSIIVEPPDFSYLVSGNRLLNKERKLIELVKEELSEGRNCFVFCEFTNSKDTIITTRLKEILERECNLYGKVAILESSSPKALKREAWLHKKAEKDGIKVFITNPRNVETGLDFCWMSNDGTIYNYPTIIFYQMGYSLFTLWQAASRHYRLNQREECRTYYLCTKDTVQPAVIQLLAEKKVATAAIQGKFSTEGLAAMAKGVDVKLRLAQALSESDTVTGNKLQEMFDVLASNDDADSMDLSGYIPMQLYCEVMGTEASESVLEEVSTECLLDLFNFNAFLQNAIEESEVCQTVVMASSKRKLIEGQMSLI